MFNEKIHVKTKDGYKLKETKAHEIRIITVGAFRRRLTLAEKVAITSSADPAIKVLMDDLALSEFVNLDFSHLIAGIDYMISTNLIKPERKAELLKNGAAHEV